MAPSQVFISYSHQDQQPLDHLRNFLKPLERAGVVEIWSDQELKAGDDWEDEIKAAMARATVAVLLVSEHFLASDFVHENELPFLLRRAEAGELTLIPVFLRYCLVGFEEYSVPDPQTGETRQVKLERYVGIGTPEKPLMSLRWEQRKEAYTALASKLSQLTGMDTTNRPASSRTIGASHGPRPLGRALTVALERQGSQLHRRYAIRQTERIDGPCLDLKTVESTVAHLDQAIAAGEATAEAGAFLSKILFDTEDTWHKVAKALFNLSSTDSRPMPDRFPVAMRIHCRDEPRLAGWPWRWATWNGRRLADYGWTFATTDVMNPKGHITTSPKPNVLVISSATSEKIYPVKTEALLSVLRDIWGLKKEATCLLCVASIKELEDAVQVVAPYLVYVHARGFCGVEGPGVLVGYPDAPEKLLLCDLACLLEGRKPPRALYLDTPGIYGVERSVPPDIFNRIPLIVWNSSLSDSDTSRVIHSTLRAWLEGGLDPVHALHLSDNALETPLPSICVNARYSSWRTETYGITPRRRLARLLLDRRAQKSRVFDEISDLIRLKNLRVLALVSYGQRGDDGASCSHQIQNHLERQLGRRGVLRWLNGLRLPIARHNLRESLNEALCLQLGDPYSNLEDLLVRQAPKVVRPGQPSIIWIDWGIYGDSKNFEPPLTDLELEDYLEFVAVHLTATCPADQCVVSHLTLEMAEEQFSSLQDLFESFHDSDWFDAPSFRLHLLDPLGRVTRADLRAFLREPEYEDCSPNIVGELARRIMNETSGVFDPTVRLIEEGERTSWLALLLRLREAQGEMKNRRARITFA